MQTFQKSWPCKTNNNREKQTFIQSKRCEHKVFSSPKAAGEAFLFSFSTQSRLNIIRKIITTNKIPKPKPAEDPASQDFFKIFFSQAAKKSAKHLSRSRPKTLLQNSYFQASPAAVKKFTAAQPVIRKNVFIKQDQQTLSETQTRKIFLNKIYNQFPFGKKLQRSLFSSDVNNNKFSEEWNLFYKNVNVFSSAASEPFEANIIKNLTHVNGFVYKTKKIKKLPNKYYMQLPQGKLLSSKDFKNKKATYSKMLEISLITISLASANRIRQWAEKTLPNGKVVGEVLNPETVHYKTLKPIKGGLFCERIFGPLKDHECACGKKFNIKHYLATTSTSQPDGAAFLNFSQPASDMTHDAKVYKKRYFCFVCDVEYTYSIIRRTQLGYIKLASPTTHVWFVKGLPSYISILLDMKKTHLQNVIYNTETLTLEHALKSSNKNDMPLTPSSIFESWQKIARRTMLLRNNSPELNREKPASGRNLNNSKIQLQIKNQPFFSRDSKKSKKAPDLNPTKNRSLDDYDFSDKFKNTTQNENIETETITSIPIDIIKSPLGLLKTNFNLNLDKNEEFLPSQQRSLNPTRALIFSLGTRLSLVTKPCSQNNQHPNNLTYSINFTKLAPWHKVALKKSPKKDPLNLTTEKKKILTNSPKGDLIDLSNTFFFSGDDFALLFKKAKQDPKGLLLQKKNKLLQNINNKPKWEKTQSLFKSHNLNRPEAGFFSNIYKQNKKTFYSQKNNKTIENGWVAQLTLRSRSQNFSKTNGTGINTKLARVQGAKHYVNRFVRSKQAGCPEGSSVAFGLTIRDLQYLKFIFRKYSKLIKVKVKTWNLVNALLIAKTQTKNFAAYTTSEKKRFFQANRAWLAIFNSLIPYGEPEMLQVCGVSFFIGKKKTDSPELGAATAQFEKLQSSNRFFFFAAAFSKHPAKKIKKRDKDLKNIACFVKSNWKFKAISVSLVPASQQLFKQRQAALIKSKTTTNMPLTTTLELLKTKFALTFIFKSTQNNSLLLWNILKYSFEKLWLLSGCFSSFSNTTTLKASLNSKKAFNTVCLLTSFLKVKDFNFFEKQTTKLTLMLLLNLTNGFKSCFATDFNTIKKQNPKKPQRVALCKIISKNKKNVYNSMVYFQKRKIKKSCFVKKLRSPAFFIKNPVNINSQIKKIQKVGIINDERRANLKIKLTQRLNACFISNLTQQLKKIKDTPSKNITSSSYISCISFFYSLLDQSDWSRQSLAFLSHFSFFSSVMPLFLLVSKQSVLFFLFATQHQERKRLFRLKLKKIQKTIRLCFISPPLANSLDFINYCYPSGSRKAFYKEKNLTSRVNFSFFFNLISQPKLNSAEKKETPQQEQNFKAFTITESKNQALEIVNYVTFLKTSKHLTHYFFFLNQGEKRRISKLYNSLIFQFETGLWPTQNKILKYLFLLKAFFLNKNKINKKTTKILSKPNPKQNIMQSEQINKNFDSRTEINLSQTTEPVLVNNLYCISHRELWEQEKNWQDFAYYYYDYSQNIFKGVDVFIPYYKHRNYDILFTPLLISNQDGIIYENNSKMFKIRNNNGMNINTSFSGAGLIQKLLNEYDFNELKKIDKQNRIVLFEYNKYIRNLKKQVCSAALALKKSRVVPRKPKAGVSGKEVSPKAKSKQMYYKACHIRDVLIRRTKLTRKILIFFESNTKVNKDTENTNYIENMILTLLPVLPPVLRPVLKMAGQFTISDLNRLYQRIIYRNERLKKFLKDPALNSSFEMKYAQRLLQEAVDNLIQNGKSGAVSEKDTRGRLLKSLSDILKGKQGRFRQYLLGKRVDYSGRSVIVVGPQLKLYECGIPKEMALVLYSPFLIKRILNEKLADTYLSAKKLIKTNPVLVSQLLREIMKSCPVLLNRAPTLHRLGFQAFQPKLIDGKAILLHPLVCPAFNADFDGDQMAVHVPITFEARAEAWKLMLSRTNLLSPATGDPLILPSQDMVLGCYYLTTNSTGYAGIAGLKKNSSSNRSKAAYFNNITDVLKAYSQKLINIHTIIWVNINANIENGHILEQPLEIRIPLTRYKLSKQNKEEPTEARLKQLKGSLFKNELHVGLTKVNEKQPFNQNNQGTVIKKAFYNLNYLEIYPKSHNIVNGFHTYRNKKTTAVGIFLKEALENKLSKGLPDEFLEKKNIFECEQKQRPRIKQIIRTTPGKILFNIMIKNAIEKQPYRLIN